MKSFDPNKYGPVFAELLQVDRARSLGEGTPEASLRAALDALSVKTAFAHARVVDESMAECCLSGVWLLCDNLDESHTLSQGIGTPSGSFWHGIMHRREGDFSNAKYWFRRVGSHSVFQLMADEGEESPWDPMAFVDACQRAVRRGGAEEDRCRQLQQREWEVLFDFCYSAATGT